MTGQRAARPVSSSFLVSMSAPILLAAVVLPVIGRHYLALFEAPAGIAALHGQSLWPALNPDTFDLAVMMFASGMLMISSALEAAARELQSENDQIV